MIRNILYLSASIAAMVLIFTVVTIYLSATESTILPETTSRIKPIAPSFDTATVNSLSGRKIIPANLEEKSPVASKAASTTPEETIPDTSEIPTATPAAEL